MSRRRQGRPAPEQRVRVDLHMHTSSSDGHVPPKGVLAAAAAGGLDVIAITDHDLPPVIAPGVHTVGGRDILVVAGVEVSTMHNDEELHLLVYFADAFPEAFSSWCTSRAQWRAQWFDASMCALGLDARADAAAHAGRRSLTRVHMARAMVDAGVAANMGAAFQGWIGHRAGRIPSIDLAFLDALSIAREAGGWTAWAHPPLPQAEAWAPAFAQHGLHALEAWRPAGGKHRRETLHRLAHRHGMAITGGSDHHGKGGRPLGSFAVPLGVLGETAKALKLDRAGVARA
jgi:predicted metal-dependent phosphoesterase TrpH